MNAIGKNTVSGEKLRAFIERVEVIRERKKECSEQEALVWAEAKSEGFTPAVMKNIIKMRAAKPQDVEEADALKDMYLHAIGMLPEPPLFRAMGLMEVDIHARDSVIDALAQCVPAKGEIIVKIGDKPVRLQRDKSGEVQITPYVEAVQPAFASAPPATAEPTRHFPDCTADEAETLGRVAYGDNQPIVSNPFPPGDERRARFDKGWRDASGGDGMGEQ